MNIPWIIVPTYNERENIEPLIRQLFGLGVANLSVLIVDDGSPDGTSDICRTLQNTFPNLHVLNKGSKKGLGRAYVSGFAYVLEHDGTSAIVQMDADFSHNPADIPRLLAALEGHDVVIGSRYCQGVSIVNWPLRRLLLSIAGNWYGRIVTGLPYHDITGGFRVWRASTIRAIRPQSIRADGYGFQVAALYRAWKLGLSVIEIPIIFQERRDGQSKLQAGIMWETFWLVWRLRLWPFGFSGGRKNANAKHNQTADC